MKKKSIINVLSKKALLVATAIAISGVVPTSVALAHGELVAAEVAAQENTRVSGLPGETVTVPVQVWLIPDGGGNKTDAATVTVNLGGQTQHDKTLTFAANEFNTKKTVNLEYTISADATVGNLNLKVEMSSNIKTGSNQVRNEKPDNVTIQVVNPAPLVPADTTAPVVVFINPISGIFNATTLPTEFKISLDEASELFVNGQSQGEFESGTHSLLLPTPTEGVNTVTLQAVDAAKNVSSVVPFTYTYDSIAPEVTSSPNRNTNGNSWYKEDVTVSFNATDSGTGVNKESISKDVLVAEDGIHTIFGTATDLAGNLGTSEPITIKLDKTAPTIRGSADRSPNSTGWYKDNVTVTFNAADTLSGVESFTQPVTLSEEGRDQFANGTATDLAGNSASTAVSGINIVTI